MDDSEPRDGAPRDRAAALAHELRAVAEALAFREAGDGALADAARLAAELRRKLGGPPRRRWYDADASADARGEASARAFFDQSPIRGRLNVVAPPLVLRAIQRPDGRRALEGRVRMGALYEGPPHGVHGGWVAALFDELLGSTQGLTGAPGVTLSLTVKYREVTPIEEDLHFEGWIEQDRGRRILARGTCHAGETLTAEAEGLFLRVDFEALGQRVKQRRSRPAGGA